MTCYRPLDAFRLTDPPKGINPIWFKRPKKFDARRIQLPCGRCVGCRLERSRQWAVRCVHESKCHEDNMFLTLTYNDEKVPEDYSLKKRDFQLFMKRFRKSVEPTRFKFFHCGEYGSTTWRPHYHALIFGYRFPDTKRYKDTPHGTLYKSEALQALWKDPEDNKELGFCSIGQVTFESASYTARYIMKKQMGRDAKDYYTVYCPTTGVVLQELEPEYCTMSQGIGKEWFMRYWRDWYRDDMIVLNGVRVGKPPKYYDGLLETVCPETLERVKARREEAALEDAANNTDRRLRVRENVRTARIGKLERKDL